LYAAYWHLEDDMRITVRGWGRDLGETEVMNVAIGDAETPPDRLSQGKLYKNLDHPENKRFTKVRLYGSADLRLGGTYLLKVELSRREIAELFFDTHKGAMIRMIQSFIEEEEREERVQMLADLARMSERRRQRAQEAEQAAQTE
jgi:hypothetical protein